MESLPCAGSRLAGAALQEEAQYTCHKGAAGQPPGTEEMEQLGMLAELELNTKNTNGSMLYPNFCFFWCIIPNPSKYFIFFLFFCWQALTWRVCTDFFWSE